MASTNEPHSVPTNNQSLIWKRSSRRLSQDIEAVRPSEELVRSEVVQASPKAIDGSVGCNFVLIEKRTFLRECFAAAMRSVFKQNVFSYPSIDDWMKDAQAPDAATLVMYVGSRDQDIEDTRARLSALSETQRRVSVALLSDEDDPDRIFDALEQGVRGYILTSSPLDLALEALRLVGAGGTFVPASSFVEARRSRGRLTVPEIGGMRLTARQMAVIDGLRRGKANKIIAYELNMRESTVKVHVRNIMKKLNARNRTQVAYIANGMLGASGDR